MIRLPPFLRSSQHCVVPRSLLLASMLVVSACDSDRLLRPTGETIADLMLAEAKWTVQAPSRYEFTLQIRCFCGERRPMHVSVRNGTVVSVRPENSFVPLPPAEQERYPSIEGLFDLIASELARPANVMRAEFDSARGFPVEVFIDRWGGVAADEATYVVGDILVR